MEANRFDFAGSERFVREQVLPFKRDEVFEFFCEPFNLERITPPWLSFKVTTPKPVSVGPGALIDYRLKLHGIPLKWTTVIEEWVPGERFVDWQLRGPYALWHHTHEFEDHPDGTLVRDTVRYRMPFGILGKVFGAPLVRRDTDRIFDYRREAMEREFGSFEREIPGLTAA